VLDQSPSNRPKDGPRVVERTRAVDRALRTLVEVAGHDGVSLADLARRADLPLSTALRLLRTLEAAEFVERDDDGLFRTGSQLVQLAVTTLGSRPLYRLADRELEQLSRETGESAYLAVPGPGDSVLYARQVESPRPVRHTSWLVQTLPRHTSAPGAALEGRVGTQGVATKESVAEDDTTAVAAPVHGPDGRIVAALNVVGPTFRLGPDRLPRVRELVLAAARSLEGALGAFPTHDRTEPT
jgi:urocanate hydratase